MKTYKPIQKVTMLLLRETITSFRDALKEPDTLKRYDLKPGINGEFFTAPMVRRDPKWQSFVKTVVAKKIEGLYNAGTSAILFVKAKKRLFAITFGYGRNLLKAGSFELDFGLKTTLNRVDPSKLRSLDVRNYEDLVLSTKKQTSRSSEVGSFGLDVTKDLLRAVTGEPSDTTFATRLAGSDALTLLAPITADELGKKCEEVLKAYQDDKYKKHFDWIDHLAEVRDPVTIATLEAKLVAALRSHSTDKMQLAPSETVNWQDVDCFQITGTRNVEYPDLEIDSYLDELGDDVKKLDIDKLKRYQIRVRYRASEHFQNIWTLFSCLIWETEHAGFLYALVDGKWFQADKQFSDRVKKYVKRLPKPTIPLLDAKKGEAEGKYNSRVASARGDLFLLDRKLVKPLDSASSIEMCDLFSKSRQFFHVKKKTQSATLSHLFSQGTISAQAYLQDESVREQMRKIFQDAGKSAFAALVPKKRPAPTDCEVVYAIIAKANPKWPASLPFFSQLNLMQHAKLLFGFGYKVSLQEIAEV